ncbi:alpha/beta hydrolase [Breznakiella homolactica]|uniref:Alpha/beta fold hydrolase n=1 Tax=Breznakiella homolactica TaxID=2798577 RepID=A0A7T8BAQ6_9SPIR|nr:alpha/beta fold hydrolase [Breznakiella homolactica]QQO09260.1 lysophospholipase [Breznakiella homolactica]
MAVFFLIIGISAGMYLLLVAVLTLAGYIIMFRPRFHSLEYSLAQCIERKEFDPAVLDLPWETVSVFSSVRNASLAVYALAGNPGSSASGVVPGTAVILHGLSWTHYGALKYARGFIEKGWNTVVFDLGGHGASPAGTIPAPAYGYYEKYDLDAVVDWTRSRFPGAVPLVLIGESMGAATVLQYAPLGAPAGTPRKEWKMDVVAADCSYTSMKDAMGARLKALHIPDCIGIPARTLVSFFLRRFRGYTLSDASPEKACMESPVPILFIHGEADRYVPTKMSVEMAEKRTAAGSGPTELVLVRDASHAKSVLVDPGTWFGSVFDFIGKTAGRD